MFQFERKLQRSGFRAIAGMDEAGRGALAGPLVAAAVMIKEFSKIPGGLRKIRDSKKMTPRRREEIYHIMSRCPSVEWGIGKADWRMIDRINVLEATKLAMQKALDNLSARAGIDPDYVIIDGNFKVGSGIKELPVVKGDEKIFSCMAAGIIAKVTRDRMMRKYGLRHPLYGFERNKGYGTEFHQLAIKNHGYCRIHRRTFKSRLFL